MGQVFRDNDAISGKEGSVFVTIGSQTLELAELIKVSAKMKLIKADVKTIGKRAKGKKIVGWEGEGSMSLQYNRPEIRSMVAEYARTGLMPSMAIQVTNADITSRAGRQTVLIKEVLPDEVLLASLDGDADDVLIDEVNFTFSDFDLLESFTVIN